MSVPRYFIYQYPTRGKYEHSPYYWWWEYLRRAEEYGPKSPIYADFGELGDDFYPWWRSHGSNLFAEQPVTPLQVFAEEGGQIPADSVLLVVPVLHPSMTADELVKKFRKAVRPLLQKSMSTARYPLCSIPDVDALRTTLAVYDLKQQNTGLTLYEVGERLHQQGKVMFARKQIIRKDDPPGVVRDKKANMKSAVSRYLNHARRYIGNAPQGMFPKK